MTKKKTPITIEGTPISEQVDDQSSVPDAEITKDDPLLMLPGYVAPRRHPIRKFPNCSRSRCEVPDLGAGPA